MYVVRGLCVVRGWGAYSFTQLMSRPAILSTAAHPHSATVVWSQCALSALTTAVQLSEVWNLRRLLSVAERPTMDWERKQSRGLAGGGGGG